MDSELIKLVELTVSEKLTSVTLILIVIGVAASGLGAFFGAYLKRKGDHVAKKEDFELILAQLKNQTHLTEQIKAEVQRDLNAFSDTLVRNRDELIFKRERITVHLNFVLESYVEMYRIAQLIPLRLWIYANKDLEVEADFRKALSQLRAHFGALDCLGVVPLQVHDEFSDQDWRVLSSWEVVLGVAATRTPEYKKDLPNSSKFSSSLYHEEWMKFMSDIEKLGKTIKGLSRDITVL